MTAGGRRRAPGAVAFAALFRLPASGPGGLLGNHGSLTFIPAAGYTRRIGGAAAVAVKALVESPDDGET